MIRSGNPALRGNVFAGARAEGSAGVMTIQGTVNKTLILLGCVLLSAFWAWSNMGVAAALIIPAAIIGLVLALVTVFKKEWAGITSPIYALVEGVVLGGISAVFEAQYQGIVFQAVTLTFAVLFSLLIAYK